MRGGCNGFQVFRLRFRVNLDLACCEIAALISIFRSQGQGVRSGFECNVGDWIWDCDGDM